MEINEVKKVLEALLFVSERSLALKEFKDLLKEDYSDLDNIENLLNELKDEYEKSDKPYEIKFVAGGWIFATKAEFSPWIKKFLNEKKSIRLSPSALEVLAIAAYKQPLTRGDIDEIRGVDSSWVLDGLLEKKLIKIVGRKEALGRPLLYGTTQEFLKHFGLAHLSDLPLIDSETLEKAEAKMLANAEAELPLYENEKVIGESVGDISTNQENPQSDDMDNVDNQKLAGSKDGKEYNQGAVYSDNESNLRKNIISRSENDETNGGNAE
ncbi:MAG: SMC-Scp complex subunit ScpB [Elusimicrobiota bacterium]|jgi:segregation and condensation protein B|nr:SMC-Scp complex subunit ScpB [Elusimicrobiota bacterium]